MRAFTKPIGYLLLWMVAFLANCQSGETKKQLDLDDIRPKAQSNKDKTRVIEQRDTLAYLYKYYANDSAQLGIAQISLDTSLTLHFLDRFSKAHLRLSLSDSTQQNFQYATWSFKDSTSCMEAFYNWLDQAAKGQQSVALGVGDVWHTQHGFYVIAQKEILFLSSSNPIRYQEWLAWFNGKPDTSPISYLLQMKPRKKTKWFEFSNHKIKAL